MSILALDPGTNHSAWLIYDPFRHAVDDCGICDNDTIIDMFEFKAQDYDVAIEMIASYGMPVGAETFETCVWIGRFIQAFGSGDYVYRREIKIELCNSSKAKDANVRQALLDRFPSTGGGKTPQVGTKSKPGPLYGVKSHIWSALGVAIAYAAREP